jgi:hypothetical protein
MAQLNPGAIPHFITLMGSASGPRSGHRRVRARVGVVLIAGLVLALPWVRSDGLRRNSNVQAGRVYRVSEVVAALQSHPAGWVGQMIRLDAVAWPCLGWATGPCLAETQVLADASAGGSPATLTLAGPQPSALLALLRDVPLMDGLLPVPQTPRWGKPTTYRVWILAVPTEVCVLAPCYQAQVEGW